MKNLLMKTVAVLSAVVMMAGGNVAQAKTCNQYIRVYGNNQCSLNGNVNCNNDIEKILNDYGIKIQNYNSCLNNQCTNNENECTTQECQNNKKIIVVKPNCNKNGTCTNNKSNFCDSSCNEQTAKNNCYSNCKKQCTRKNSTQIQATRKPCRQEQTTKRTVINEPTTRETVTEKQTVKEVVTQEQTTRKNSENVQKEETTKKQEETTVSDEELEHMSYVNQVIVLVNQERAKAGLNPVTFDSNVETAASVRVKEIEISFSHTRPNGTSFSTVLKEKGVNYRMAGENIAWGQQTPKEVMNAWMNSEGHRANILNPNYTKIGVGYYQNSAGRKFWSQLFVS